MSASAVSGVTASAFSGVAWESSAKAGSAAPTLVNVSAPASSSAKPCFILCLFFIRISPFVAKEKARCAVQRAGLPFGNVFLRGRRGSGLVGFAVFFVSIIELLWRDTGIQTSLQNNRIVAAADRE